MTGRDPLQAVKVCRRAAELVEQGWCQRALGRDALGRSCDAYASETVAWCLHGALMKAEQEVTGYFAGRWRDEFLQALGQPFQTFNDAPGRTAAQVADALRDMADHVERAH